MTNEVQESYPDEHATGLLADALDPGRYDGHTDDPREVAGMLHALMPNNVRVLDVGCGTGSVTIIANRGKNNAVFGVEPDPHRAAIARSRGIETHCGVLTTDYLSKHGLFDVIM